MKRPSTAKKQEPVPSFGQRVREIREAKGMSQRDLAAAVPMGASDLCNLEAGRRLQNPSLDRMRAIAAALGVGLDALLSQ